MAATQMGWAFQFAPTGAFTLEANVIFETYALALAFAKTDPTAVVGKVISVSTGDEKGVYMIEAIGTNGSLKKVGSDVDLSNYVTKDQITSIYTYKGTKATYEELVAIENPKVGDAYNVEGEVEITLESPLGDTITKKYPAGTNWVWNGSEWDAQGGSIDLSAYATKEEVRNVNESLTGSISSLTGEVNQIKTNLDKKVDAVEGSSLITSEKLALIDTNASAIAQLQQTDTSLDTRLKVVESAFTGDGGTIDLGDLTTQLTDHGNRITVLEGDNTTNKTNISNLQTEVSGHGGRLTAIENLNTEQGTQLSGLTTRVENVEKYGESITNLTTIVNGHTEEISNIKTSISGLAVKSVSTDEKVLAANENGVLSTTIKLDYDSENKKIQLKGIADAVVTELDATQFVKDGMLDSATYDTATKEIVLTWNTDAGKDVVKVPMGSLVDTYTAGSGLKVESNEFSVVLDTASNNKLTVTENGLLVDISADITALESTMDDKIEEAFTWVNVE